MCQDPSRILALVGGRGGYSNAEHDKSHLARKSVLYFPLKNLALGMARVRGGDPLHGGFAESFSFGFLWKPGLSPR